MAKFEFTPPQVYTEDDESRYQELESQLNILRPVSEHLWGSAVSTGEPLKQGLMQTFPPLNLFNVIKKTFFKSPDEPPLYIPFSGYQYDKKDVPEWLQPVYLPTGANFAGKLEAEITREQGQIAELQIKQSIYDTAAQMIENFAAAGQPFESADELFALLQKEGDFEPQYLPTGEDMRWFERAIEEAKKPVTYTEEELYEMLEDPVIRELLERGEGASIPLMLVTEANTKRIAEALRGLYGEPAPAEIPEGYTEESALDAIDAWMPQEDIDAVMVDFEGEEVALTDAVSMIGEQLREQMDVVGQMKEAPNPTVWQYLMQPMLKPLELLTLYSENISQPIAGTVVKLIASFQENQDTLDFMKHYNEAQEIDGTNHWSAASTAFEEWEVPWINKLLIEMIVDPLSYLGIGVIPKVFGKFGKVGAAIAKADLAFGEVLNVPFDELLKYIKKIPKLPGQVAVSEGRMAQNTFARVLNLQTGKKVSQMKMDEVVRVMDDVLENGWKETASPDVRTLYNYLADATPISEQDIVDLSRKVDGFFKTKDTIDASSLEHIQSMLDQIMYAGTKAPREAIDNFLLALHAIPSESGEKAIKAFIAKKTAASKSFIQSLGREANPLKASEKVRNKVINDWKVFYANPTKSKVGLAGSKIGQVRLERGAIKAVTLDKVDKFIQWTLRKTIYQVGVNMPAKLYLGFTGYYFGNVIENLFRSVVGGSQPSRHSAEFMAQKFLGYKGSPVDWANEAVEALGAGYIEMAALGRETVDWASMNTIQRMRSVFSKDFLLGDAWIRMSARHGAIIRNGYFNSRFQYHLVEHLDEMPILEDFANRSYQFIDTLALSKKVKRKLKDEFAEALAAQDPVEAVRRVADSLQEGELKKSALRSIINEDSGNMVSSAFLHNHIDNATLFDDIDAIFDEALEIERRFRLFQSEEVKASFEQIRNDLGNITITSTADYHNYMQRLRLLSYQYQDFPRPILREAYKAASLAKRNAQKSAIWDSVLDSLDDALSEAGSTLDDIYNLMRQSADNVFKPGKARDAQLSYIDDIIAEHTIYRDKAQAMVNYRRDFFQANKKSQMTSADWDSFYEGLDAITRDFIPLEMASREANTISTLSSHSAFKPLRAKDFSGQAYLSGDDLGYILGSHPNPITNAILNNAYLQDEDMFVATIRGYANVGKHTVTDDQIRAGYRAIWGQAQITDPQLMNEMGLMGKKLLAKKQSVNRLKASQILKPKQKQQIDRTMKKLGDEFESIFTKEAPTDLQNIRGLTANADELLRRMKERHPNDNLTTTLEMNMRRLRRARSDKARLSALADIDDIRFDIQKAGLITQTEYGQIDALISARTRGITQQQLQDFRQQAFDLATRDFYRNFPAYDDDNALNALMRLIYPYWNYEWQRPLWVSRLFATKPIAPLTWSRYVNYTDRGYLRVGSGDYEFNPFRGTIFMGGFFGLLYDYPEYETDHPALANLWDFQQRMGFYPNFIIQALYTGTQLKAGEFGRMLPAPIQSILDLMGSVPAVGDSINRMRLRHGGAFLDYNVVTLATKLCQEQEKMFTGIDIWNLIEDETIRPFEDQPDLEQKAMGDTPQANQARKLLEMKSIWEDAQRKYNIGDIFVTQTGVMRIYPKEREEYMQELMDVQKTLSGLSEREIKEMWRNGYSLSQAMGRGYTPDERKLMERLEGQYYWAGITQSIRPYDQQLYQRTSREYYTTVSEQRKRYAIDITKLDKQFLNGEISFDTWAAEVDDIEEKAYNVYDVVKELNPEYAAIPSNLTERIEQWEALGLPQHGELPQPAAQYILADLYFGLEPQWTKYMTDTGDIKQRRNWEQYFAAMDYIDKIAEEWGIGAEWAEIVESQYSSPLQALRRDINEKYITRYWQLDGLVMEAYFIPSERDYLELVQRGDIDKPALDTPERELWNNYQSRLRDARKSYRQMLPEADYWLRFFGIVETSTTKAAEHMWEVRGRNLKKVPGYEQYPDKYPLFVAEDANRGFDWDL
jgi:hypothetical protein